MKPMGYERLSPEEKAEREAAVARSDRQILRAFGWLVGITLMVSGSSFAWNRLIHKPIVEILALLAGVALPLIALILKIVAARAFDVKMELTAKEKTGPPILIRHHDGTYWVRVKGTWTQVDEIG